MLIQNWWVLRLSFGYCLAAFVLLGGCHDSVPSVKIPIVQGQSLEPECEEYSALCYIDHVIFEEGGYGVHPSDPGGETKYGITKKSFPHLDIANLTLDQADSIYYHEFYLKYKIDKYPTGLQFQMLDMSINMGSVNAIKVLQRTINIYLKRDEEIKVDGIAGRNTMYYAYKIDIDPTLLSYARSYHYFTITKRNAKFDDFIKGWLFRTRDTSKKFYHG